MKRILGFLQV